MPLPNNIHHTPFGTLVFADGRSVLVGNDSAIRLPLRKRMRRS